MRATLATGVWFDPLHDRRAERVAVLGPGAARRLHVDRVSQQPVVFVGDEVFVVIGILADTQRHPDLLNSIIVPEGTASAVYGLRAPGSR